MVLSMLVINILIARALNPIHAVYIPKMVMQFDQTL